MTPLALPPLPSLHVLGTLVALEAMSPLGGVPRTRATLLADDGALVEFIVPGANGGLPGAVRGVPVLEVGERWRAELVSTSQGWIPRGLGQGLRPDDGRLPVWNLNGLRYDEDQRPLVFFLNEAGSADLGLEATERVFVTSLTQWSGVGCATWNYLYGGLTPIAIEDDGINVVAWEDEAWAWGDDVLGMSITRFETVGDTIRPSGADILYNGAGFRWVEEGGDGALSLMNAGSIITHELGHVTGMDHEYHLVTSTMFLAYLGGEWMATLSGDDRRGLCENYPSGLDECVKDTDCEGLDASERRCVEIDGIRVCDEVRAAMGAPCSRTDFNCEDWCVFTNRDYTEGYCAVACEDDSCPAGYHCEIPRRVFPDEGLALCLLGEPDDTSDTDYADDTDEMDTCPDDTGDPDTAAEDDTSSSPKEPGGCACSGASGRPGSRGGLLPFALLLLPIVRRRLSWR